MRRGARPSKATGKAKRPVAPKSEGSRVRDLEKHLAEAQEQQAATAEILRVISSSPADVQPVFDVIVRSAVRLCDGLFGSVFRFDGELMHLAAHYNYTPTAHHALLEMLPMQPRLDSPLTAARAILTRAVVQFEDVEDADTAREYAPHVARAAGFRSGLAVPMLREGNAVGAIFVAREQPGPFSAARIALLQTFADQAVIAIENVRLFTELQEKNRALTQAHAQVTESLEQQTATSEILRVISSSPTDVQPVFDAIVANAAQLCGAEFSAVMRFEGGLLHLVAVNNMSPAETAAYHTVYPRSPGRHFVVGRAFVEARPVHVADIEADPDYDPRTREIIGRAARYRTILGVPILRDGVPIGVIGCGRHEMKPFTAAQIELVQTFADQAVIAIENVRLFKELEARNRDLTATGEILQVISRSPTDAQPVFDTIARSAVRLCGGGICGVFRVEAERVGIAAIHGLARHHVEAVQRLFPIPLDADSLAARAIREGRVLQVPDTEAPDTPSITRESGRVAGFRTQLTVPMLHDGRPIGSINVMRPDPGPFSDNQISLLQTFADQAVIAIENVRLFTELQEKNRALTEALDQQTATSEVLKIISRSTFDLLPVLEILVENATRLCGADWGTLYRLDGEVLRPAAFSHASPEYIQFWRATELSPGRGSCAGRAALERRTIHIADVLADPEYELTENQRRGGFRGLLSVPLLREGMLIGVITMARNEVRPFTENQIALLQTFADQAVIAIENVRLLSELQARTQELTRSVGELTALGDVGRALSSTLDLDAVLQTIVTRASQLAGTDACSVFEYDEETEAFHLRATNNLDEEVVALARRTPTRKGEGVQGRMAVTRQPVQVPDIAQEDAYHGPLREILLRTGTRAVLAVPMLRENELIGGLTVNKRTPGPFSPATIDLLTTFATQSALAIQNARLFREIELKSRELEAASQHKSEFLANMSHELRTPLNAVIGFSEVLTERMFGELNEKQDEYLKDIHASGQHLLSLINDILDLSKIEAGRMELEVADFDLPMTIDNALMLVRERAARRNIALRTTVDERLGQVHADERKIRQVLLNLLSNAIKFTPEGGRIHVEARPVNESIEVSVTDTGVGIAAEDQEAVFEEFRQVGTADKKVEGTGLGLALSRKFVELHGGKMWVKSQVGAGSTFTFAVPVPVRRGE